MPFLFRLDREANITLHFANGRVKCEPHESLTGFYDGQCYRNYTWDDDHGPPTEENKVAVKAAFEHVYGLIRDEGPFDGVLGFSQGSSCLSGFLIHHETPPAQEELFKFAILFSTSGIPEWDTDGKDLGMIRIPTLHVCGEADKEWVEDSKAVVGRCENAAETAELIVHKDGHAVPKDRPTVDAIIRGIKRLVERADVR